MSIRVSFQKATALKDLITNENPEAIQLIRDMLMWHPKKPTCVQAFRCPYVAVGQNPYNNSKNSLCSKGNSLKCRNKQKVLCGRRNETLSGLTLPVELKTKDLSQILWYKTRQMPREVGDKKWGEGIKDSSVEFESLPNEIDSKPVSYSKIVSDNAYTHLNYVHECFLRFIFENDHN